MYAKYCGGNTDFEGLFNYNWQTEGAGQIVAFNSQHCPRGLRKLSSPRTDYNPSDVALPSQRFLKYGNSAVQQQQKRLNLHTDPCSVAFKLCLLGLCAHMCMHANNSELRFLSWFVFFFFPAAFLDVIKGIMSPNKSCLTYILRLL